MNKTSVDKPEWPEVNYRIHEQFAIFHEGVRVVEMPCCGFTFGAIHRDTLNEPYYSCPLCAPRPASGGRLLDGRTWGQMPGAQCE